PAPALVSPAPVPLITAEIDSASAVVIVRVAPPRSTLPLTVEPTAPVPVVFCVRLPPRLSVPAPVVTLEPAAEPLSRVSVPIVSLLPFRSSVAPEDTVTAVFGNTFEAPDCSVPALTVVLPV